MTSIEMGKAGTTPARQDSAEGLSHTAIAYAIGAAVAVLFNTLLAWVKDSYDPLNTAMAKLTGHHWTTHGLAVVIVFLGVGFALSRGHHEAIRNPYTPIYVLCGAVIAAGLGLVAWFVFN